MKVAVVTSCEAAAEPRAPRHAVAARRAFPKADISLIDIAPEGRHLREDPPILDGYRIRRRTLRFPTRSQPLELAARRVKARIAQYQFSANGVLSEAAFGPRTQGLSALLADERPDMCIAHNIETLLPAASTTDRGTRLIFDCMEFYSDMGDGQSPVDRALATHVEKLWLPKCQLVLSTSERLSEALADRYGIEPPLASHNVPPLQPIESSTASSTLRLYWRNAVIGFGQRGLEDAFLALRQLPDAVTLCVQGHLPNDGGRGLRERLRELGLDSRVEILPPYPAGQAVRAAARYDVGLCLERSGPRNHELTVSNKMFDYHMAGLAVVSSDLSSLRDVITRSGAGLLYAPGDSMSLARAIGVLLANPELLQSMKMRARRFAETEANLDKELEKLSVAFRRAMLKKERQNK